MGGSTTTKLNKGQTAYMFYPKLLPNLPSTPQNSPTDYIFSHKSLTSMQKIQIIRRIKIPLLPTTQLNTYTVFFNTNEVLHERR